MEKLEDPFIRRGTYRLEVRVPLNEIEKGTNAISKALQSYNRTCESLAHRISDSQCRLNFMEMNLSLEKRKGMNDFLKQFFPRRSTKGFITAVGGMDSDDRKRIDKDLDIIRKNEEKLRSNSNHQTETLNSMYKFVDTSVQSMDIKFSNIMENYKALHAIVQEAANHSSTVKNILNLEAELLEIGFRIQTLLLEMDKQQSVISQILLGNGQLNLIIQLIDPFTLVKMIEEAEQQIPIKFTFPKDRNGEISVDVLKYMKISHKTLNKQILLLCMDVPLISRQKYECFKGRFFPQINASVIISVNILQNILIKEINNEWGFLLTEEEFDKCIKIGNTKLCSLERNELELYTEDSCLLNLKYHNSTKNCQVKAIKAEHDVWLATEEPNTWNYLVPNEIKVHKLEGRNHTFMTLNGNGKIKLTPDMSIITNTTKITYNNVSIVDQLTLQSIMKFEDLNFTIDSWKLRLVPILDKNTSTIPIFDHKKLFDLGVDIEDLKRERPILENIIYSPLDDWSTTGIISGVMGTLIVLALCFMCCFKGNISCSQKQTEVKKVSTSSSLRDSEIIHFSHDGSINKFDSKRTTNKSRVKHNNRKVKQSTIHCVDRLPRDMPPPPPPKRSLHMISEEYEEPINTRITRSKRQLDSKITTELVSGSLENSSHHTELSGW